MEHVDREAFLADVRSQGIGPDERYSEARYLIHLPDRPHHRFWEIPVAPLRFPVFIATALDALAPWSTCDVWPRKGWMHASSSGDPRRAAFAAILRGVGARPAFDGALRYSIDDRAELTALLFAHRMFGWNVGHDCFVVPDHRGQILLLDHDGALHVSFAQASMIDPFARRMAAEGFPLPTDVPDHAFKRPDWMPSD